MLIVDDEPEVLKSLENIVKVMGYEVDSVSNGTLAIQRYRRYRPEIVLLDWRMPKMDGAMCAKRILDIDPAARIVLISGYQETEKNSIDADLKNMIKAFIRKPCDLEELSRIIAKAIRS